MLASRPGLKAVQEQFLEVLVLRYLVLVFEHMVLVLNGGLGQDQPSPFKTKTSFIASM